MPTDRSLERLINQTLLVSFPGTAPPQWLLDDVERGVAGVCLFSNNIADAEQLARLCGHVRDAADEVIVSLDEEGGDVTRIHHDSGSDTPGNLALGAVDDPELTREVMRSMGARLRGLGITLNLAPVADVNVAADNPTIGTRSFGADAKLVARHTAAAITGLHQGGVAACAKHFPGHGATRTDSHTELPVVDADRAVMAERDLPPFVAAIEAGVRAILSAHITYPALGVDGPATHTPGIVTELLRGELGFTGAVVTDALEMRGASQDIGVPEAAVRALAAGCDLLCLGRYVYSDGVAAVRTAVTEAVRTGRLPVRRLEEAAERTAELAGWRGTPTGAPGNPGLAAARRAVQVQGDLPPLEEALVVELATPPLVAVGAVPWGLGPWFADTRREDPAAADSRRLLAAADGRPLVLVVRDAHRHPDTRALVDRLCRGRPDAVVVEMGVPQWRPDSAAYVRSFGAARVNARAAAEALLGRAAAG